MAIRVKPLYMESHVMQALRVWLSQGMYGQNPVWSRCPKDRLSAWETLSNFRRNEILTKPNPKPKVRALGSGETSILREDVLK